MIPTDEDARLLARAGEWAGDGNLASLSPPRLMELAQCEGLDFATALLHDRVLRELANAGFARLVQGTARSQKVEADLIGVVPGAFHREHRGTGADGARALAIARELNCTAEVIPTASFGTLEENAHIIADWLAAHRGRRIGLLSLSKGGADVKRALGMPGAAETFADVSAW